MNAEIQTLKKSIGINAPKEKVWAILLQDNYTRIWYAEFSEGTHAETDWQLGSKAIFMDSNKDGLVGTVVVNRPNEVISIKYDGFISGGKEDYESEGAQAMKGTRETYRLTENNGITQLAIELDTAEEYFLYMSSAWNKALEKIKELAEKN